MISQSSLYSQNTKMHMLQIAGGQLENPSSTAFDKNACHTSMSEPSSDLCYIFQNNSMAIQKAGFLPEEKLKLLKTTLKEHVREGVL